MTPIGAHSSPAAIALRIRAQNAPSMVQVTGVRYVQMDFVVVVHRCVPPFKQQSRRQWSEPTALPCPPYVPFFRTASLGCRNRAVKFAAAFTWVPPFRSKRSGTPLVRPRKRTTPRRSSPLFIEHNASLACASKRKLHRYVKQRTDCESCLDNVHTDTVYFL